MSTLQLGTARCPAYRLVGRPLRASPLIVHCSDISVIRSAAAQRCPRFGVAVEPLGCGLAGRGLRHLRVQGALADCPSRDAPDGQDRPLTGARRRRLRPLWRAAGGGWLQNRRGLVGLRRPHGVAPAADLWRGAGPPGRPLRHLRRGGKQVPCSLAECDSPWQTSEMAVDMILRLIPL